MSPENAKLHSMRSFHPGDVVRHGRSALQSAKGPALEIAGIGRSPEPGEAPATSVSATPTEQVRDHRSNVGAERISYFVPHGGWGNSRKILSAHRIDEGGVI